MSVKRYHAWGKELEDTEPDLYWFWVRKPDYDRVVAERDALRAALQDVLGFCATNQGPEAEMAIDAARAAVNQGSAT